MTKQNPPTYKHLLDDGWDVVVRTEVASIYGPIEVLPDTDDITLLADLKQGISQSAGHPILIIQKHIAGQANVLALNRDAICNIITTYRASNPRRIGVQYCVYDDDICILVDPDPKMSLFDLAAIRHELLQLLGVKVHVLTSDALPEKYTTAILASAIPL
jgi:hypothetical protein